MGDNAEHRDTPLTDTDVKASWAEFNGRKAE